MAIGFAAGGVIGAAFISAALWVSNGLKTFISQTEGLKVVYEGQEPDVDIVLVHGLGGDPIETWTSREGRKPVNWTTDLLPKEIKGVLGLTTGIRVLSYGYSSKLFSGDQSGPTLDATVLRYLPQALYLHSNRLLEQLANLRNDDKAKKRRIIFIAHSLGGLIVKSALVQASVVIGEQDVHLKAIELLTVGVLFFGTPQRELQWKKWSDLFGRMLRFTMKTQLKETIQPLADQAEVFNLQIERYKSIESNFPNFSFHEKRNRNWVVTKDESLPAAPKNSTWERYEVSRNHKDLVKFNSTKNPDLIQIINRINDCLKPSYYENARSRYKLFFDHINSPKASDPGLIRAERSAMVEWEKLKPELIKVSPYDSEQEIFSKEEENKKCLRKSERLHGLCDFITLAIVQKMAEDALVAREYEKAEALYKRLFVSIQAAYSPCSEKAAAVLEEMAKVAIRQGRLVEATKTLYRVRDVQLKVADENSSGVLRVTERIVNVHVSRGMYQDALQACSKIIDSQKRLPQDASEESRDLFLEIKKLEASIWRSKGKTDKDAFLKALELDKEIASSKERKSAIPNSKQKRRNKKIASRRRVAT